MPKRDVLVYTLPDIFDQIVDVPSNPQYNLVAIHSSSDHKVQIEMGYQRLQCTPLRT